MRPLAMSVGRVLDPSTKNFICHLKITPNSNDIKALYSFDYAQQVHFPSDTPAARTNFAFDCTQGHEALSILHYPSQTGEFKCHEALGILHYPSQMGEFDCTSGHALLGYPTESSR